MNLAYFATVDANGSLVGELDGMAPTCRPSLPLQPLSDLETEKAAGTLDGYYL